MYIYDKSFNFSHLLNDRERKAFKINNDIFKGKTTRRGFSRTSFFEPAYGEGMFVRDASMQVMVHNACGDLDVSRSILKFILSNHLQSGDKYARHIIVDYHDDIEDYDNTNIPVKENALTAHLGFDRVYMGVGGENNMVANDLVPDTDTILGVEVYLQTCGVNAVTNVSIVEDLNNPESVVDSVKYEIGNYVPKEIVRANIMFNKPVKVEPLKHYFIKFDSVGATNAASVMGSTVNGKYRAYNYDKNAGLIWDKTDKCLAFALITDKKEGEKVEFIDNDSSVAIEIPSLSKQITSVCAVLYNEGEDTCGTVTASLYKGTGENKKFVDSESIEVQKIAKGSGFVDFGFSFPLYEIDIDEDYTLEISAEGLKNNKIAWHGEDDMPYYAARFSFSNYPDTKEQVDGNYMVVVAWAQYVNLCQKTPEDIEFINASYKQIRTFTNYVLDHEHVYDKEKNLVRNPCVEHAREGRYWNAYDLITNVFASQAFHEMTTIAYDLGYEEDSKRWKEACDVITKGINEHLVVDFEGKKIYAEMLGYNKENTELKMVKGFAYENFAPIGADWFAIDLDIMENTAEAYRKHTNYKLENWEKTLNTVIVLDDNDKPSNWYQECAGKLWGWELILCALKGDEERIKYLLDMRAARLKEENLFYAENYRPANMSDLLNQENAGVQIYAMAVVFPQLFED